MKIFIPFHQGGVAGSGGGGGYKKFKPLCPIHQPLCLIIIFSGMSSWGNLVFVDECRSRCYENDKN